MLIHEILTEATAPLRNGTIQNGIAKMLQGYHQGRDEHIHTCYNWVGSFLRLHPAYDNGATIVRFWGIKRATVETSLIVHGDAIAPFHHDEQVLSKFARLDPAGKLLISDAPDSDYPKMQLVAEYSWAQIKSAGH